MPFEGAVDRIVARGLDRRGASVYLVNVHMIVEGRSRGGFSDVLRRADYLLPDGMPIVWLMRAAGAQAQPRIAGMDLLPSVCDAAEKSGAAVFFLGGTDLELQGLRSQLRGRFPSLRIAGMKSPPFRPMTDEEDQLLCEEINESGANIVLVALGCPKQETWIDEHRDRVQAIMVGLGAAFGVFAGLRSRAPAFMQRLGLEWFYRLLQEPRRLWKRYLRTNLRFGWLVVGDSLRQANARRREGSG